MTGKKISAQIPTKSWQPLVLLLILGAFWGGNPIFAKALALEGLHPLSAVFWQSLWAGTVLASISLVRGMPIRIDRAHLAYYGMIGGVGTGVAWVSLVYVAGAISASYGAIVVLLSPLLTYVFAVLVRIEGLRMGRVIGIGLGFAGACVLVLPKGGLPSPELWLMALLGLLVPAGYATSNVYAQWGRPKNADNISLAAGTMFVMALVTGSLALVSGNFHQVWLDFDRSDWLILGWGFSTAASYYTYYRLVSLAGAVYMGQVGYIAVLLGVAWGVALFGETIPVTMWAAAALVIAGVALVNFGGRKKT